MIIAIAAAATHEQQLCDREMKTRTLGASIFSSNGFSYADSRAHPSPATHWQSQWSHLDALPPVSKPSWSVHQAAELAASENDDALLLLGSQQYENGASLDSKATHRDPGNS